jgi:hypothetical protein
MATWTPLKIELMVDGTEDTTWGDVTNENWEALEAAVAGSVDVIFSSGPVTLSLSNTSAPQDARNLRLNLIGTSGGAQNLVVPTIEKLYFIKNGVADTITVKTAAGSGVAVPAGASMVVYVDGVDVVSPINRVPALTLATALAVSSGGTGADNATDARTNLGLAIGSNIPSPTGTGASGTWAIDISGNAATATDATNATQAANATAVNGATSNGFGTRTVSTLAPTGGVDGDIWYQY